MSATPRRGASPPVLLVLLCLLPAAGAAAQERMVFDFDEPPETDNALTDRLSYGAAVELEGAFAADRDLERAADDDAGTLEPKLALALTYQPNPTLRAFVDLELTQVFAGGGADAAEDAGAAFEIKEAYLTLRELADGFTAQLGRLPFTDPVEWYYDEELDGARGVYRFGGFALEASLTEEGLVDRDWLNDDDIDDVVNAFLVGHRALGADAVASAYVLRRDGRERAAEDLLFAGVQYVGEPAPGLRSWLNVAYVTGEATDDDGARDLSGFGFDLVGTYVLDLPLTPSLTLGVAYGAGDGDPDDDEDDAFRQTGLHGNEVAFAGVTAFNRYGEALAPELSNLLVYTLGLGLRPSDATSLDLVYHHYRQDEAADELRDSALDAEPSGDDRALGDGVDLVLGFEGEELAAELVVGAFFPGDAFAGDADPAYVVSFEVQLEF